ncbi:PilW family protein [Aquabacterium sp. CECT 9606]|uniref:PilW family protein n=1 Tax=Aquabacterium sp. CECT 9606 TaxID=2845822 RepID=UPI001E531E13|nr:PilW family protein [Aquabacterium sp. CECT 9606]
MLRQFPSQRKQQTGLSLVELIVAMVIGLTVVGAALAMYVSSGYSSRGSSALSQMTEDASIALGLLRSQVAMAGYGKPIAVNLTTNALVKEYTGEAIFGCTGGPTADTQASPLNSVACTNNAAQPDSITVLYQADINNTVPTTATPPRPTDCLGNAFAPRGGLDIAENRYYVASNTLMCLGNGNAIPQPLVENIQDIKILYGVARATGPTSNGVAERYLTAQEITGTALPALSSALWTRVTSARICVVVRSDAQVLDEVTNYFGCDGQPETPADRRLYRAFTTTVVLQNRLPGAN